MDLVAKYLDLLNHTDYTFKSIYEIMREHHRGEVFSETAAEGRVIKTTYNALFNMVENISGNLCERFGSNKSRYIGIYMDNSNEWAACFWAILKSGNIPVLLNTRQDMEVTNSIIGKLGAACSFSSDERVEGCVSVEDFLGEPTRSAGDGLWSDEVVMVTSGSTSEPKLICHNGQCICRQIELTGEIVRINPTIKHNRKIEIRILAFLPFYHIFGLVSTLMWFSFFGRTLIFLPDYSPKTIQHICRRQEVTHFFAIPLVWEKITSSLLYEVKKQNKLKVFDRAVRLSNRLQSAFPTAGAWIARNLLFKKVRKQALGTNLNFCIAGGGFISERTVEIMNGIGYSLYQGYGLTESGIVSVNLDRRPSRRSSRSCGRIFSDIAYRVNGSGELEIASGNCFKGIFKDGGFEPNRGEYYCTNDKVRIDEAGELLIIGRSDDVIVAESGENISPEAIEQRLDKGGLKSASILYMMYEGRKQIVLALEESGAESAFDRAGSLKALFDSVDRLPMVERPQKIVSVIGEVPYTLKAVNRKRLTSMLENGELFCEECVLPNEGAMENYKNEEYQRILSEVKKVFAAIAKTDEEQISDTSSYINDLKGDSLGYVELLCEINDRLGVEIQLDGTVLLTPMAFADCIFAMKSVGAGV
ncbi:MAG: AMP-binding protein [Butyrivibrio sp.]|nr:AMP-binding protein [Butyrivibrio sp.]